MVDQEKTIRWCDGGPANLILNWSRCSPPALYFFSLAFSTLPYLFIESSRNLSNLIGFIRVLVGEEKIFTLYFADDRVVVVEDYVVP